MAINKTAAINVSTLGISNDGVISLLFNIFSIKWIIL